MLAAANGPAPSEVETAPGPGKIGGIGNMVMQHIRKRIAGRLQVSAIDVCVCTGPERELKHVLLAVGRNGINVCPLLWISGAAGKPDLRLSARSAVRVEPDSHRGTPRCLVGRTVRRG